MYRGAHRHSNRKRHQRYDHRLLTVRFDDDETEVNVKAERAIERVIGAVLSVDGMQVTSSNSYCTVVERRSH